MRPIPLAAEFVKDSEDRDLDGTGGRPYVEVIDDFLGDGDRLRDRYAHSAAVKSLSDDELELAGKSRLIARILGFERVAWIGVCAVQADNLGQLRIAMRSLRYEVRISKLAEDGGPVLVTAEPAPIVGAERMSSEALRDMWSRGFQMTYVEEMNLLYRVV